MTTLANTPFDALIVGAGPAGAHLGYLLARRGCAVAIIDKSSFPRDKVCGGGISRKTAQLLDFDLAPLIEQRIGGAYLTVRNQGSVYTAVEPALGCTVLRNEFDDFLLHRACAAGARFFARTTFLDAASGQKRVTLETDRGALHGRLLVGADGVASAVRGKLFGKQVVRYVPALEALLVPSRATPFDGRALFDFGAMLRGYGWIFPKREHLNVGIYSLFGGRQLRARLAAFLAHYERLRQPRAIRYQGFAIPVCNAPALFQGGRVWLLGDAAGLADALFGEGIYFALKSAALAAQALAETGFAPHNLRYSGLLKRQLLPELRASQWLGQALFAAPAIVPRLLRNPRAVDNFAGVIGGAVGYRQCLARTLVGLPQWLLAKPGLPTVAAL